MKKMLFLFFLSILGFQLNAQEAYSILFNTGEEIPVENIRDIVNTHEIDSEEVFDGYFYL